MENAFKKEKPDEIIWYDPLSGRYFESGIEKMRKAVNDFNRKMRDEMQLSLCVYPSTIFTFVNEFYYEIGLDRIKFNNGDGHHE